MVKGEKFKKMFESEDMASYQAILGLLKYRRSIRGFRKEPLPGNLIEKMLEAARGAPSAGNAQPWEFLVIEDTRTIQRLGDLYEYQMVEKKWLEGTRHRKMRMYQRDSFPGLEDKKAIDEVMRGVRGKAPFRNAPCMIFPLADKRWHQALPLRTRLDKGKQHLISSMANTVFTLHLAAATLNLATQWISDFGSPWLSGMARDLLDIPQHCLIYEPMAVGYPSYYPKPRYVKPADELVHYEKYDSSKNRSEDEIRAYIATHIRPQLKFKV